MIWDISTWSREPCNPSTTRSARGCHPCLRYDLLPMSPGWTQAKGGGDGGIRTLDRPLQAYNGLANRRLQPLGPVSVMGRYARRGPEPQATEAGGVSDHLMRGSQAPQPGRYRVENATLGAQRTANCRHRGGEEALTHAPRV